MIEHYNRMRNVQHVTVHHNETITGHINQELIDKIGNIRSFINYIPNYDRKLSVKTVKP